MKRSHQPGWAIAGASGEWRVVGTAALAALFAILAVALPQARSYALPSQEAPASQPQHVVDDPFVWQAPASVKLWADSAPVQWSEPLHLARNDSRGFHVAITSQQAGGSQSLPAFTASSRTLNVKVWLEAPVWIATPSDGLERTGWVLDALVPVEAQLLQAQFATLPAGETRAWFVEASTTSATTPGRHIIDLKLGDWEWRQVVQVYDVVLDPMPTLLTAFGTGGDGFNEATARAHGITDGLRSEQRFKLLRLYHDDLAANQMAPYSLAWPAVFRGVSEATMLHSYYDCANDRMNWPSAVVELLDYHFGAAKPIASTFLFYYGAYRYENARNFKLCGLDQDAPGFEDAARRFFAAVARDMEARGYLDRVGFFADEPMPQVQRTLDWWEPLPFAEQPDPIRRVVRAADASSQAGIPTGVAMFAAYAIEYWTNPALNRGRTPFDRWVFHANRDATIYPDHPNDYDPTYDRYVQPGDQKWIYGGRSHMLHTDSSALEQLAMGLTAYKFDLTGILAWAVLQMSPNPWQGQITSWGNGATDLYYPPCGLAPCASPSYTIVPSYRLKLLAESFRLHHYLKLLEAKQGRDATLAIGLVDAIVWESTVYNQDWRLYEAARTQVLQVLGGGSPTVTPPAFTPTPASTPRLTPTPTPVDSPPAYAIPRGSAQVDAILSEFKGDPITFGGVSARLLWDETSLYAGFSVQDRQILAPLRCGEGGKCDPWNWDSVQVLVDPLNNGGGEANFDLPWMEPDDIQVIVSAGGEMARLRGTAYKTAIIEWSGLIGDSDLLVAVQRAGPGYNVEMAIPWADLGITPFAGQRIGLSLAQTDKSGTTSSAVQWQQKGRSFQASGGWPRVLISDDTTPSTTTPTPTATVYSSSPTPTESPTLTPTESLTPIVYTPSPTATPSPTPSPTPRRGPPRLFLEAEAGSLTEGMEMGQDPRASGLGFVNGRPGHPLAAVNLVFEIQDAGDYVVWLRGMGRGPREKSFLVSVDGAPLVNLEFEPVQGRWDWGWQRLSTRPAAALAPASLQASGGADGVVPSLLQAAEPLVLSEGTHVLTVLAREPAARLDGVLLTGDTQTTPGLITGATFVDSNGDGVRNPTEAYGLAGVPIRLHNLVSGEARFAVSDLQGAFAFEDVPAGVYEVASQPSFGYLVPSASHSTTVILDTFGDSFSGVSFGFLLPTGVIIASLSAEIDTDGVVVRWVAHGQDETARYALWWAETSEGVYEQVSDVLVFEERPDGAAHTWVGDASGAKGWYKLELVDENEFFGPVQASGGEAIPQRLYLPVIMQ